MTLLQILNTRDRFAAANGIRLTEIREGYARAEMTVAEQHLNAGNVCQGGAIFTLADLTFAAVTNSHGALTFGIENQITFHSSGKLGDRLIAEATETVNHKKIPYCQIRVTNQDGTLIASATGLAYRKEVPFAFDALM